MILIAGKGNAILKETSAQNAYAEWLKNKYKKELNTYLPTANELQSARYGAKITDMDVRTCYPKPLYETPPPH